MKEYIEREALIQRLNASPIFTNFGEDGFFIRNAVLDIIEKQPTADVVEVVRCKDCIYYNSNCCFNRQWDFESSTEVPLVRETDFCSYGERKGD